MKILLKSGLRLSRMFVVLGVVIINFMLIRLAPGDPSWR